MTINDYRNIYLMISEMANDAEGFGLSLDPSLDYITDEDVEKCKWITAILEIANDVPARRASYIMKKKNVEYDYEDILEQLY